MLITDLSVTTVQISVTHCIQTHVILTDLIQATLCIARTEQVFTDALYTRLLTGTLYVGLAQIGARLAYPLNTLVANFTRIIRRAANFTSVVHTDLPVLTMFVTLAGFTLRVRRAYRAVA